MRPKRQRVTIKDVAAKAGVSITTVSHVLNDVPGLRVNPDTRDRVLETAKNLGYLPNGVAQSLRTQRSNMIGVVGDEIITTPFAGGLILGAQEVALSKNSVLFVVSSGYRRDLENREIEELLRRQVDGILYASMYHRKAELPELLRSVPSVFMNAECTTPGVPWVAPDEVGGGWDAADTLLRAGHKRVGFVNNTDEIPASVGRLQGFRERLALEGLPEDHLSVATAKDDPAGGYIAVMELLTRDPRPTGIFCFNDRMAMGAYRAAAEMGLRIPDDLSIVGFDNQEYVADGLFPGLTTIELAHYEMGVRAAEQLFLLIEGKEVEPEASLLRGAVVTRDSVSAPPSLP